MNGQVPIRRLTAVTMVSGGVVRLQILGPPFVPQALQLFPAVCELVDLVLRDLGSAVPS